MPIHTITRNGKKYYKWGNSGKEYPTRAGAVAQAQAAYASGYQGKAEVPVDPDQIDLDHPVSELAV